MTQSADPDPSAPAPSGTGETHNHSHHGGCLCAAVRFHVKGAPDRVGLCHCLDCRKAHGAPFNAFAVFASAQVRITGGDDGHVRPDALGAYVNAQGYRRYFCRRCGSPLHGASEGQENEIEIPLGLFDETGLFTPTYEGWIPRREPWLGEMHTISQSYEADRPD